MRTKEEQNIDSLKKIAVYKNLDKALEDLIEIIQFAENVSLKIHGLNKDSEIFRVVNEEFLKSKRYSSSICLLDNDGLKLRIVASSASPKRIKLAEKVAGIRLKRYQINLKKSRIYSQVVNKGQTLRVKVKSIIAEMFSLPTTFLISKIMGYQRKESILTPLYKHNKIIGVFAMTSVDLAEYFIPSVKNLARHISEALEISDEYHRRRKTEQALKDSEIRYRTLFGNVPIAIGLADPKSSGMLECNQAMLELTGYSEKEIKQVKIKDLYQRPGERTKLLKKLQKEGFVHNFEIVLKRKDGKAHYTNLTIVPFPIDGQSAFLAVVNDITEQKKINQAKTEFVSLASHQLRTPLTTISWYTELLLTDNIGRMNGEQKKYLKEIYTSNQRLVKLVNSLLNVSRIDVGTFIIEPELINIRETSDNVLSELLPKIQEKGLIIKKNYSKSLPKILADPKLVRIIFQNLLSNAVKYSSIRDKVTISIKKEKPNILIKVSDTGCGIPRIQQSEIFTKFFRADNAKEKDPDGTGLGLYITKSIIEKSGGKIWFESEEEKGTTFYVTIPLSGMKKKEGTKELAIF